MHDPTSPALIEVSYLWTLDEFLAGSERNWRRTKFQVPRWSIRSLAIVSALFAVYCFLSATERVFSPAAFFAAITLILWFWTSLGLARSIWRRGFLKAGSMAQPDQKFNFVIDEHRIRKLSAGAESSWVWELVPLVAEVPGGFLLQFGGVMHWLPDHGFAYPEDRERFALLAASRAVKFVGRSRPEPIL